jgi:hypothetical protein
MAGHSAIDPIDIRGFSGGSAADVTFSEFLDRLPKLNLALSAAALALSKTVLRQSLVPHNLEWLSDAAVLVCIVSFLCVFARLIPVGAKKWLILAAALSLSGLLAMRIQIVEHFDYYGEGFNELRGWTLSPFGAIAKANLEKSLNTSLSLHDVIYYSGHSLVVDLFGSSWYLAAASYSFCFLVFLFTVISVAGLFELDATVR